MLAVWFNGIKCCSLTPRGPRGVFPLLGRLGAGRASWAEGTVGLAPQERGQRSPWCGQSEPTWGSRDRLPGGSPSTWPSRPGPPDGARPACVLPGQPGRGTEVRTSRGKRKEGNERRRARRGSGSRVRPGGVPRLRPGRQAAGAWPSGPWQTRPWPWVPSRTPRPSSRLHRASHTASLPRLAWAPGRPLVRPGFVLWSE